MNAPVTGRGLLAGVLMLAGSQVFAQEDDGQTHDQAMRFAIMRIAQTPTLEDIGKRVPEKRKTVDIFKGKSWYVAPPKAKPLPPPPPPPPTAPPVPYTYMGSYQGKDGRTIIFLTRGDQVYSVTSGDVLEGTYRVGGIESGQLVLIYLPLNIRQTINIGEAS